MPRARVTIQLCTAYFREGALENPQGRATGLNPKNRFEPLHLDRDGVDLDGDGKQAAGSSVATQFLVDASRSVLAENASPNIGFRFSLNPYRGCEHGCVYCYARPSHEFLGWSAGVDFESRILVKTDAPELLDRALARPSWEPQTVALSGNTDCYQQLEKRLQLTRRCLAVFLDHCNPVGLITKSFLVTRDIDVLADMAQRNLIAVTLSVTTLSPDLATRMEPRASGPGGRLKAIEQLAAAGIPVGVNIAPLIPGLNDEEIPAILKACRDHGAGWANYILLRLPGAVQPIFVDWVRRHYPDRADKVLNRLRAMRGGGLSDPRFGTRMSGTGKSAKLLQEFFGIHKARFGFARAPRLATDKFRRVTDANQLELSFE